MMSICIVDKVQSVNVIKHYSQHLLLLPCQLYQLCKPVFSVSSVHNLGQINDPLPFHCPHIVCLHMAPFFRDYQTLR